MFLLLSVKVVWNTMSMASSLATSRTWSEASFAWYIPLGRYPCPLSIFTGRSGRQDHGAQNKEVATKWWTRRTWRTHCACVLTPFRNWVNLQRRSLPNLFSETPIGRGYFPTKSAGCIIRSPTQVTIWFFPAFHKEMKINPGSLSVIGNGWSMGGLGKAP